jgi:hypothetical protein
MIVIAIYFINDPFKVLYHYDSYYPTDGIQYVGLNNEFTAVETFLNQYPKYKYDSYIFGSSRALLFHTAEWHRHVPDGKCFQFAVGNESLFGVERKFHLIDSEGAIIKNALIIFDYPLYSVTRDNPLFPKHTLLSGKSKIGFQINTFKGFFDAKFLVAYIQLLITHKAKSTIFVEALNNSVIHYDLVSNDVSYPKLDPGINADTGAFYGLRKEIFGVRSPIQLYTPHILKDSQIVLMNKIKQVLDKDKTSYKIVISPLYDQLKIDTADMRILCSIFGRQNIYDYSGINNITASKYNYYESAHFRTFVANRIMDSIYAQK